MGLRPTFNFPAPSLGAYGTPLVDKRLGDAFQVVSYVASHMDFLLQLTPGGSAIRVVEGRTILTGQTVTVPLPEDLVGVKLMNTVTSVLGTDGALYDMTSGHWTHIVRNGQLEFTLKPTAPLALQNSPIYWNITYERQTP